MINAIIDAISIALNSEFGDDYTIYDEEVKQGLQEPCFFISCINPANELFLGKRYFRENKFAIQYFPADKARIKEECNDVAERMYLCLEWLTVDSDPIHGTKMSAETVDGVLNFFINYDMFVYKNTEYEAMDGLSSKISVKG